MSFLTVLKEWVDLRIPTCAAYSDRPSDDESRPSTNPVRLRIPYKTEVGYIRCHGCSYQGYAKLSDSPLDGIRHWTVTDCTV